MLRNCSNTPLPEERCSLRTKGRAATISQSTAVATALVAFVMVCVTSLVGCQDTNRAPRTQSASSSDSRASMNDQNLSYAFSVLRNTEEYQTIDSLATVVGRLNQWSQAKQTSEPWEPDALLATLPDELRELPVLRKLGELNFPASDGTDLQQIVWLSEIAERARGNDNQPLAIAQNLFDWVVRNIQIERDNNVTVPHLPREILIQGRGTLADRAWIFALLGRQQGLDIVELAMPAKEGDAAPRLWLPALFHDGELYLFDVRLGLPIPGPAGKPVATLNDVIADDGLLRALDIDEQRPYPVHAADLDHLTIYLEESPVYVSHRMQVVEAELPGKEALVLTAHPAELAERVKSQPHVERVVAWPLPYERLSNVMKMDRETQQKAQLEMAAFQFPSPVLYRARVLHLLGSFEGENGANALYQSARPSEADMKSYREKAPANALQKVDFDLTQMQTAKQTASYWLGLIAFERGNYPAAVDYLQTRTLAAFPDGPWSAGARYNLGRALEALGQKEEAIRFYRADLSAQRHGNLLRARGLEGTAKPAEDAAEKATTEKAAGE